MLLNADKIEELTKIIHKSITPSLKRPYNIDAIITSFNGKIEEVYDYYIKDHEIVKDNNNVYSFVIRICLNKIENEVKKNYVKAHLLGHLFMHMGFMINDEKFNKFDSFSETFTTRNNNYSTEESEANFFALSLLLPKNEFMNVCDDNLFKCQYDVNAIAKEFNVSESMVCKRGKQLGFFAW